MEALGHEITEAKSKLKNALATVSVESAMHDEARNYLSWAVFILMECCWLPLQIVLAAYLYYIQVFVSKRLGVSQTAVGVFNGRWAMDAFEMRPDEATRKFGTVMENTNGSLMWIMFLPLWVKYKISGKHSIYPRRVAAGKEGFPDMIITRTLYFDEILNKLLTTSKTDGAFEQFVILGAGYDTRSYRKYDNLKVFEIDRKEIQAHKLRMLKELSIDHSHVTFLTVDFCKGKMIDSLKLNGFDTTKKSIFLMEGVSIYLSEADLRDTFKQITSNTPNGSVLVADFYAERLLKWNENATRHILRQTDESFGFGLPFRSNWKTSLEDFVKSEEMTLREYHFMGCDSKAGPYMVVSELVN